MRTQNQCVNHQITLLSFENQSLLRANETHRYISTSSKLISISAIQQQKKLFFKFK